MKQVGHLILTLAAIVMIGNLSAQNLQTPAPSPGSKVEQAVGVNNFTLTYSRPAVKGRELFVEVEKWDQMWRTGANAGTVIEFDADASFEGKKVPAGKYLILSTPGQTEWTWMIYSDTSIGGNLSKFEESKVVAKFTSKTNTWDQNVERLTFIFSDMNDNSTNIGMFWGKYYTRFNITVDTESQVMAQIEKTMKNPMAQVGGLYAQSATFYYENDKDLGKALEWMNKAIEINPNAFWNIHSKANILGKMGKKKEAIATAEESLAKAKTNDGGDFGYIKRNEDAIAMWKKK